MTPFHLHDKTHNTSLDFSLPSSWQEVTLGQSIAWEAEYRKGDIHFCKQLEILTGIEESTWRNCTILSLDRMLNPYLQWTHEPMKEIDLNNVPDEVTIDGKTIAVPKNIELKTFAQYITFKTSMAKYMKVNDTGKIESVAMEFFPLAIAIYLYPEKEFDDAKAMEFAEKCKQLPLVQASPLSTFFFLKFLNSENETVSNSTTSRTISKRELV